MKQNYYKRMFKCSNCRSEWGTDYNGDITCPICDKTINLKRWGNSYWSSKFWRKSNAPNKSGDERRKVKTISGFFVGRAL